MDFGCSPHTVTTIIDSVGKYSSIVWTVEGDTISTNDTFTHTFIEGGYHYISVEINYPNGNTILRSTALFVSKISNMDVDVMRDTVITSYSIHYTKLYEDLLKQG